MKSAKIYSLIWAVMWVIMVILAILSFWCDWSKWVAICLGTFVSVVYLIETLKK